MADSKLYQLTSPRWDKKLHGVVAELASPLLDPVLHPSGSLLVRFDIKIGEFKEGRQLPGEPFQAESLMEYLNEQSLVRQTLEAELLADRQIWDPDVQFDRPGIWQQVTILYLILERKKIWPIDGLANMKKIYGISSEDILPNSDTQNTRSCYEIVLDVPWDEEHGPRIATFRDGKFVGMYAP